MSVFSQFFLAFMSRYFSQFALSSAGHLNSPWRPASIYGRRE